MPGKKTLLDRVAELTGKPAERVVEPIEEVSRPQYPYKPSVARRNMVGPNRGKFFKSPGASILDKCVASMEPSCWYAGVDIRALAGITYMEWTGLMGRQWACHGWLTRRKDPEYQPRKTAAETSRPLYLYTLTPAGVERRRLLLALKERPEHFQEG